MPTESFLQRISALGLRNIIVSKDFLVCILVFIILILIKYSPSDCDKSEMLNVIMSTSGVVFSIILAGLAIVTTFTDENFIQAWIDAGEFENTITLFQYNLYLPILTLILSFIVRFFYYTDLGIIIALSMFSYMLMSLLDLIRFISHFALQRGEFIDIQNSLKETNNRDDNY